MAELPSSFRKLLRAVENMRSSIDPLVPVQVVHTFLVVANNEGKTLTELAEIIGTNSSTASRHLLDLGEFNRRQEPGYGLVDGSYDPTNRRAKRYCLTPKGKLVLRSLIQPLED